MSSNSLGDLLTFLVPVLPMAVVWLCGLLYALVSWRRHPSVSGLAVAGCGLFLLNQVGGQALTWWIVRQHASGAWNTPELNLTLGVVNIVRGGVSMVGATLLLVAVFGWRDTPRRALEDMDLEPRRADMAPTGIRRPGRDE